MKKEFEIKVIEKDLEWDSEYIKIVCDSAYKEDKKHIDRAIKYLSKR